MHVQANVETALAQRLFRIRYGTRAVGTAKINWLIDLIQLIYVNIEANNSENRIILRFLQEINLVEFTAANL